MSSSSFRDLRVWQEAMRLAAEIYRGTASFPKHELYGLSQQLRRAAVSVPSNIPKAKGTDQTKSSCISCSMHEVRFWNYRRS
jgi:four helix bundle protein